MTHHQLRLAANKLLKIIIACTLLAALSANANPVRIAVASNFKQTLEAILPAFEQAFVSNMFPTMFDDSQQLGSKHQEKDEKACVFPHL